MHYPVLSERLRKLALGWCEVELLRSHPEDGGRSVREIALTLAVALALDLAVALDQALALERLRPWPWPWLRL